MAIVEPFVLPSPETSLTNSPVAGKSAAPRPKKQSPVEAITSTHSIFEIDQEIDAMIEAQQQEFEANGLISAESMLRFEQFLHAMNAKVDRIGGYIRATENIANCSKLEADRLSKRARAATNKVERVKSMLLYYMKTRERQSIEGTLFTARICKNSADTVTVTDKDAIPAAYRRHDAKIDGGAWESILALLPRELQIVLESSAKDFSVNLEAIKIAKSQGKDIPGAEVKRGDHLRIG
ncbi:MAG: siphovirus Gp157 family protein [Candidatus Saccharimonadales bacterium]